MADMGTMTNLALDDEEQYDAVLPIPMDKPEFPPGCRFTLTDAEFDKLGLDPSVAEVGAVFSGRFVARICYVSHTKDDNGNRCRMEAQMEALEIEGSD